MVREPATVVKRELNRRRSVYMLTAVVAIQP
jgi:hypothetical protein